MNKKLVPWGDMMISEKEFVLLFALSTIGAVTVVDFIWTISYSAREQLISKITNKKEEES